MDYEVLYNIDQQYTAALAPAVASIQLNAQTVGVPRVSITAVELWENTDLSEYKGLGVAERQAYSVLMNLGMVDVSAGTNSRVAISALFPVGSTTRANLVALIQLPVAVGILASVGLPPVSAHEVQTARARYGG